MEIFSSTETRISLYPQQNTSEAFGERRLMR